ncbi:hypothetical protein [Paenibacillus oryzae]|uniref:hypothetical protein n=1 Tax=Paenibacillus oryzae TaxID=1844972 RepID=UPI0012E9C770|nr:hypothetical protein [Paenibacillus oryzae]
MIDIMLHDWLPYLLSISLLCTLTCIGTVHLLAFVDAQKEYRQSGVVQTVIMPIVATASGTSSTRLVRRVKRKDAPDDDDNDCVNSLAKRNNNQRGGLLCPIQNNSRADRYGVDSMPLPCLALAC